MGQETVLVCDTASLVYSLMECSANSWLRFLSEIDISQF